MDDKAFAELFENARLAAAWLKEQEMSDAPAPAGEQPPQHDALDNVKPPRPPAANAAAAQSTAV